MKRMFLNENIKDLAHYGLALLGPTKQQCFSVVKGLRMVCFEGWRSLPSKHPFCFTVISLLVLLDVTGLML